MKKLPFSLLLLLTASFAMAQITTTNWLYQFDEFKNTYGSKQGQRRSTNIKMLNIEHFEDTDNLFGTHLFKQVKDDKMTVYKDVVCTQPYQKSEMQALYDRLTGAVIDTTMTLDIASYKEELKITRYENQQFPSKDIGYRVRQDWNFDQTTQKLSSTIKNLTVTDIEKKDAQQYFSIKVKDGDKAVTVTDFKNDDFILVQRIACTGNFAGKGIEKYLLTDEHFKKNKVYEADEELSFDKVHQLFEESIDTIITFDPETFAEEVKIVKIGAINKSEVGNYRIIQDFYLDPVNMVIKNKIIAIAPLRRVTNKLGAYLYEVPLFWIVYDDAFLERDR